MEERKKKGKKSHLNGEIEIWLSRVLNWRENNSRDHHVSVTWPYKIHCVVYRIKYILTRLATNLTNELAQANQKLFKPK